MLLDCIVTAVISMCILKKNLSKLVNFCAAIFILKMEENVQHFIISRKVKIQQKCKRKISAVYGEGAVTDWMCQKWFVKFLAIIDILAK